MIYTNISEYWGDVGLEVSTAWYTERAIALGVHTTPVFNEETGESTGVFYPSVVITRMGLVIDGVLVATPAVS